MKERIKQYYEYLIATDPEFAAFVEETAGMTSEEIAITYHIEKPKGD